MDMAQKQVICSNDLAPVSTWTQWLEICLTKPEVIIDSEYYWAGDCDDPSRYYECHAIQFQAADLPTLIWSTDREGYTPHGLVGDFIRTLIRQVPVVFHNVFADLRSIEKTWGIRHEEYLKIDDNMIVCGLFRSELPKTLDFCGSIDGPLNHYKHLGTHDPHYQQGDVLATHATWLKMKALLQRDPITRSVYERFQLPLIPHIHEAHKLGIAVNNIEIEKQAPRLEAKRDQAIQIAQMYTGYPINLNSSPQVKQWLFDVESITHSELRKKPGAKYPPTNKDAISILQDEYLLRDEDKDEDILHRIERGAHPLVEAIAQFNSTDAVISNFIRPLRGKERCWPSFGIHSQSTGRWSTTNPPLPGLPRYLKGILMPDPDECWVHGDYSAIELRIIAALANDELLLEGFANGYDLHSMHTAQAFGWDTAAGRLHFARQRNRCRDYDDQALLTGHVAGCDHLGWQIGRPEINAGAGYGWSWNDWKEVEAGSDAVARTSHPSCQECWAMWVMLGGPPPDWEHDDDLRRRFVKGMVFKFLYGGIPETAHRIPGVNKLGLAVVELIAAGRRWMALHIGLERFWDDVKTQVETAKLVRTPFGRPRRLLHYDMEKAKRAGLNHPMQGGAADFLNGTIIYCLERAPWARLVYTCHDYLAIGCPVERADETEAILKQEAERPRRIGQHDLVVPFALSKRKSHVPQTT
jgi:DNA polymerase I-like protein with 3'-5' exonuclease and polymerase domains